MPKPKTAPRSRDRRTAGSGKAVYKREKGEADNYAGPASPWVTDPFVTKPAKTPPYTYLYAPTNKNAARDQRRWDATVTSKKVRSSASNARKGKKTK